jgi:hypothetical protein
MFVLVYAYFLSVSQLPVLCTWCSSSTAAKAITRSALPILLFNDLDILPQFHV